MSFQRQFEDKPVSLGTEKFLPYHTFILLTYTYSTKPVPKMHKGALNRSEIVQVAPCIMQLKYLSIRIYKDGLIWNKVFVSIVIQWTLDSREILGVTKIFLRSRFFLISNTRKPLKKSITLQNEHLKQCKCHCSIIVKCFWLHFKIFSSLT